MFNSLTSPSAKIVTLVDILRKRASHQSEEIVYTFLLDGETESDGLTYQALDRQARTIAATLQSYRTMGERALLLYPPGLEFVAAFFGCLYAGVVAVPIYPPRRNQKTARLEAIIADAGATIVLTTASLLTTIQEELSVVNLRCIATDDLTNDIISAWKEPSLTSQTLAFLQYTSGSTGTPKGVMVSHGNLLHNSARIHKCFGHHSYSKGVIWLPPYHDMGLIGGILQPLYGGFPVILMSPAAFIKKPLRWLQAISRYRATTSGGPDFAYDLCVHQITAKQKADLDLSSWDVAFIGAEPVRAQTLENFAAAFEPCGFRQEAFYPCYGMAETTLIVSGGLKTELPIVRHVKGDELEQNRVVTASSKQEGVRAIVGCGRTGADQKIAIVDPESSTLRPPGQVGEIWVSSASVAQGYWRRAEQTEQTFHAYLAETGEGPFLRTGDLGFLHDGEVFVTGRLKDLMIVCGRNHYPQDIEMTVEQCHPVLRPGCGAVFSVEIANQERLIVAQEVERTYLRSLNANEVIKAILRAVSEQHELQVYAVLLLKTGSIPKTSSGKIQRSACREGFLSGSLAVVADWSINPKYRTKYQSIDAEVDSLLQQVQQKPYRGETLGDRNLTLSV